MRCERVRVVLHGADISLRPRAGVWVLRLRGCGARVLRSYRPWAPRSPGCSVLSAAVAPLPFLLFPSARMPPERGQWPGLIVGYTVEPDISGVLWCAVLLCSITSQTSCDVKCNQTDVADSGRQASVPLHSLVLVVLLSCLVSFHYILTRFAIRDSCFVLRDPSYPPPHCILLFLVFFPFPLAFSCPARLIVEDGIMKT